MADENSILGKYPELIDSGEYRRFTCSACGTVNGTTIHKTTGSGILYTLFGKDKNVVVCGNCWEKFEI